MCRTLLLIVIWWCFASIDWSTTATSSKDDEIIVDDDAEDDTSLDCKGLEMVSTTTALTAYFPSRPGDPGDGDIFADARGQRLNTLQDFLENRAHSVSVSVDAALRLPYGTIVCCVELNRHFGRRIRMEVRDTNDDLLGVAFGQVEICVRSEKDSYEAVVNLPAVTVFI